MKLIVLISVAILTACGNAEKAEPVQTMDDVKQKVQQLQQMCIDASKDDPHPESIKFRCGMKAIQTLEGTQK